MSSTSLISAIAKFLGINEECLQEKLNHPETICKINKWLSNKSLRTNYKDRNDQYREIKNARIGFKAANDQFAYEGFLAITVQQHFYIKHRIRLQVFKKIFFLNLFF